MILDRLKDATAAQHRSTERLVEQFGFLQSLDGYRLLLERFWGFYAPLERQIAAHPAWAGYDVGLDRRLHAPALASDLAALGVSPAALGALPQCQVLPPAGTFPYTLGCMYVLEGATLGGQIIARQLGALGLAQGLGSSFYASYGADVGPMWRAFRALLVQVADAPAAEGQMLGGARDTFQALGHWLERGATV